jgi:hypothetical protein
MFTFQNQNLARIACMSASIFYMINPLVIHWLYVGAYPATASFAMPLVLVCVYKGFKACETHSSWFKYALVASLLSVIVALNSELTLIFSLLLVLYVVFIGVVDVSQKQFRLLISRAKFLLLALFASLLVNLYWLAPTAFAYITGSLFSVFQSFSESSITGIGRLLSFSNRPLYFIQVLRLDVFNFDAKAAPLPFVPWVISPYVVALGLFLFGFAMLAPLIRRDKHVIFFAFSTVIFTGFAAGVSLPFGAVYRWLWENIFFFKMLTDPMKFLFISLLGISVLLGVTAAKIYESLSKRTIRLAIPGKKNVGRGAVTFSPKVVSQLFACGLIFMTLVNSYPIFSGDLNGYLEPINVPNYYFSAYNWLKSQDATFRIIRLPLNLKGYSFLYTWSPVEISTSLFSTVLRVPQPMIDDSRDPLPLFLESTLLENSTQQYGKFSSLWNVKYVIVSNDMLNIVTGQKIDTDNITNLLEHQQDLEYLKSFGALNVYLNKAYSDNWIYGSSVYVVLPEEYEWSVYTSLINYNHAFNPNAVVLFSSTNIPNETGIQEQAVDFSKYVPNNYTQIEQIHFINNTFIPNNTANVTYTMINPTKYIAHVESKNSFVLVLSQTFDPLWHAKIVGGNSDLDHFETNFYANGWYINKTGNFDVTIEYVEQTSLDAGIIVSTFSSTVILSLIIMPVMIKRFSKKHERRGSV